MEAALQAAERRRLRQDQIYQSKMSKLTEDMTSLERENRERLEDYRRKTEEKERERENEWRRKMEDAKEGLRRKVEAVEGKVMQEEAHVSGVETKNRADFDVINHYSEFFYMEADKKLQMAANL